MRRASLVGRALLVAAMAAPGCGQKENGQGTNPGSLTPAQETATKEYVALLEQQIKMVEQTAGVLAGVRDDPAAKDAARQKLLQLSVESDALNRRTLEHQPADLRVIVVARERVAQRQQEAANKLLAEVRRINQLPGGESFFQTELRPLLDAAKGR